MMVKNKPTAHHTQLKKHAPRKPAHKHREQAPRPQKKHAAQHRAPQKKHGDNDLLKNVAIIVLALALVAVLIWAFTNDKSLTGRHQATPNASLASTSDFDIDPAVTAAMQELADDNPYMGSPDAPVTVIEFADFQCGYCGLFWKETLPHIKEQFIDTGIVKFVYRDFAIYAQKAAEAAQCAHEQGKFWEYHDLLFANQQAQDENSLKKYAADIGLDVTAFEECLSSGKHADEVRTDGLAATENGFGGTPGFIINGQKITGALPYQDFLGSICAAVPTAEPCTDIVQFTVTVLSDEACTGCDVAGIKATTTSLFPGATYKDVDASTEEGQELIEQHQLEYAPAFLFPQDVAETMTWESQPEIQGHFIAIDDGYRLKDASIGAAWPLNEEAQEAYRNRFETYAGENLDVLGATSDKPRLDYFVMAFCPYGNPADEAAAAVHGLLGDAVDIVPHYIIGLQDGQMSSLHGVGEGNQGVRELCALEEYGYDAFFSFVEATNAQCASGNVETCWEAAAAAGGLTESQIAGVNACFDDRWTDITTAQSTTNYALRTINPRNQHELIPPLSSPTFLINGEAYLGSRDAESLKQALCDAFVGGEEPSACGTTLTQDAAASSGSC
ncbi:DsbA family protein [Candidatus Woesearchaeota archaeon]|nr:DsbA family protein [Candidatus Woesearchaeota archaeon]